MNLKKHTSSANNCICLLGPRWIQNCRLQPVGVGVGPMESLYGGSCLDEEERVYAVEDLRLGSLGVDRFMTFFILFRF